MSLLRELTEKADDCGVKFSTSALADSLEAAGYKENENVTDDPDWLNTKDRLGRYIIGQIINCLRSGMPPHPVALKFISEYEALTN